MPGQHQSLPVQPGQVPDEITGERRALLNLAYRMLGTLAEAEDAVQEAYARWYAMTAAQQQEIVSPAAWLRTVTGRVCLDLLGSARLRRERYLGQWLPEPLPDHAEWIARPQPLADGDPADRVTLDETVSMAFLVVLDSMTPAERVAFVLHDVFGYAFADVAQIVGRSPAACRKLASSARHRIGSSRPPAGPRAGAAGVVRDFRQAWEAKDIGALIGLLDPGVVLTADSGGLAKAALRPVEGAEHVARFALGIAGKAAGMTLDERNVNGEPGLVIRRDGATDAVVSFAVADGRITRIWAVRNPDKLRSWATEVPEPTPGAGRQA